MKIGLAVLILVGVFFVVSCSTQPLSPLWPTRWQSYFQFVNTSATRNTIYLDVEDTGYIWYDFKAQKSKLINLLCPIPVDDFGPYLPYPCTAILTNDTIYQTSDGGDCCIFATGVPLTSPDWLVKDGPIFTGTATILAGYYTALQWNLTGAAPLLYYTLPTSPNVPFNHNFGSTHWVTPNAYIPDNIPPHVFNIPNNCYGAKLCPSHNLIASRLKQRSTPPHFMSVMIELWREAGRIH
eukprot:TRINITY_DN3142_c0_g1_i1.p1 TRINITY_DN3142_c0_g1~~TRINITY_DN3142_c0_g1_i1.p1  ORF type:complete len:238 (-),score=42.28 TRINITY_DN3142_c0_g1_i1:66-779(-)